MIQPKIPLRSSVNILVPYRMDPTFSGIFGSLGFDTLWTGDRSVFGNLVRRWEFDVTLEWQRRADDFTVRDMLRAHGRKVPIILMLNWNRRVPDNFEDLDYAGFVDLFFKIEDFLETICIVLPEGEKKFEARRIRDAYLDSE
jgi:hypothetical protein